MKSDETVAFSPAEILDALGQAVIVTDLEGRIVYWNDAAEELFLWSAQEAIGQNTGELTVPPTARAVGEEIMEALRAGHSWSGGFPLCRKDGTQFPALVTDSGIYRDGELVGLVGITTNLGSAIRPLLERSTDAAIVLRSDAVVAYASPAVTQLFGWEDSIVGTSVVDLLHPDERPALAAFMEQVVRNPGAHPALDLRVLTEQGWVWCEAALTNLLDDPVVRGLVCNLRLNTHRQAYESAERQVEQLNTALRSRVLIEQAKGFLAAKYDLEPDQAFEHLRRYSRSHHVSIHEVARRVVGRDLDLEVQ
ncbi:MAG TPA: PAS domain-containing protein [Nocardioidaceae bacterium]|nr:PAS domain-containing protein [Nocardioidaceae bacterium]